MEIEDLISKYNLPAEMVDLIRKDCIFNKFMKKYGDEYLSIPSSISGKYHRHEPKMVDHVKRVFYFAQELCKDTGPMYEDDILVAVVLHDVGKLLYYKKGLVKGGKYYKATGYTRMPGSKDHGVEGSDFLNDFGFSPSVCEIVRSHMGQFGRHRPCSEGEYIVAFADYLASNKKIVVKEQIKISTEEREDLERWWADQYDNDDINNDVYASLIKVIELAKEVK